MKANKTFDQLLREQDAATTPRRPRRSPEHHLQSACVQWFSIQYPLLRGRLFAVPNGGGRSKTEAARLKAEGVVAGVSDLILLKSNRQHGALLIEMKTTAPDSRQSQRQQWWQQLVTADGEYKYIVCRSLQQFIDEVRQYLSNV